MLGSDFLPKLRAAGLAGKPFAWSAEGTLTFSPDISPADRAAVEAFVAGYQYDPKADLVAYAQRLQETVAAAGVTVNVAASGAPELNVEASSDAASLALLSNAMLLATANPNNSFQWVQAGGVAVSLTAPQITTIFNAVAARIQATFNTLAAVIGAINAGIITTEAEIDTPPSNVGAWPS